LRTWLSIDFPQWLFNVTVPAEMLRAMAVEPAYQRIPVIMISSLWEDAVAERCKGYAAFLHKPFSAGAVLSTVSRVLGSGANDAA
jgi:DNA-binding NtrC family response regulator